MEQVRVHVVFSQVGQSIYELVNEGLNDTGWDKELGNSFYGLPSPSPFYDSQAVQYSLGVQTP